MVVFRVPDFEDARTCFGKTTSCGSSTAPAAPAASRLFRSSSIESGESSNSSPTPPVPSMGASTCSNRSSHSGSSSSCFREFQDGKRDLGQSTNSGSSTPAGFMQFATANPFRPFSDASTSTSFERSSSCGCNSLCFRLCEQFPNCTAGRIVFGSVSPFRRNSSGFMNINRQHQLKFISTPTAASRSAEKGHTLCPECAPIRPRKRMYSALVKYDPEHVGRALASLGIHVPTAECGKSVPKAQYSFNCRSVDEVSLLMPNLPRGDYYTQPSIKELEARERAEPGYCCHVKNLVVGRKGKGSVKFLGEVNIRQLDLGSIIQFNEGELIVYMDDTKKPPVGQGLNWPAEITLLNVRCINKLTGQQYTDGPQMQSFVKKLGDRAREIGADFSSYDPHRGEWKFHVPHF